MSSLFQTLAARTLKEQTGLGNTVIGKAFGVNPSTLNSRILVVDKAMSNAMGFQTIRAYLKSKIEGKDLNYDLPVPGELAQTDDGQLAVVVSQVKTKNKLTGVLVKDLSGTNKFSLIEPIKEAIVFPGEKVEVEADDPTQVPGIDESIVKRIQKIVTEQLGVRESDVKINSNFIDDLGADSLDLVELVMALEDEFEKEIPDDHAESMKTVLDAVNYIMKLQYPKGYFVTAPAPKIFTEIDSASEVKEDPDALVEIKALVLPSVLVVVRDGSPIQIDKTHKNFSQIEELLKSVDASNTIKRSSLNHIYNLIDMKTGLKNWGNGRVEVKNNAVYLDSVKVDGRISGRMVDAMISGDETLLNRLAAFLEKLDQNPSFAVVTRLYDFLVAGDIEIADDGDLICWKSVQHNYLDRHSGTMDNSPGIEVRIKRNMVDENQDQTCSYGLHVCSQSYLTSFYSSGDRIVKVKVNPADWVAVPKDYNNAKARVCGYLVLEDVTDMAKKNGWVHR